MGYIPKVSGFVIGAWLMWALKIIFGFFTIVAILSITTRGGADFLALTIFGGLTYMCYYLEQDFHQSRVNYIAVGGAMALLILASFA